MTTAWPGPCLPRRGLFTLTDRASGHSVHRAVSVGSLGSSGWRVNKALQKLLESGFGSVREQERRGGIFCLFFFSFNTLQPRRRGGNQGRSRDEEKTRLVAEHTEGHGEENRARKTTQMI
ncbi:unnamed protein product [Arctogadus glacialis]